MRLVCPNCDAKYEVPEDAIPETGRDVQCANCGHAWFQMRPRVAEVAPLSAPPAPVPPAPVAAEPAPEPVAAAPAPVVEVPASVSAEETPPQAEPVVEDAPVVEVAADAAVVTEAAVPDVPVPDAPVEEVVAETVAVEEAVADAATIPAEPEVVEPVAEAQPEVLAEASAPVEAALADAAGAEVAAEAAVEAPVADDMAAAPEPVADSVVAAEADPVITAVAPEPALTEDDAAEDPVDIPASAGAIAAAGVAAYAVDESVLAILREEAEREAQARKADGAKPLETQTDLGLEAALPAAQKGILAVHSDPASGDETPEDKLAARRTRLPDVEEINSTLRPSEVTDSEADTVVVAPVADGRSSFRSGFLLVMTLAILVSALYGSADAIASAVPALAGPLQAFVSFIDGLRLNLDGLMQSATVAIDGN